MSAMLVYLAGPGGEAQENFLADLCREITALDLRVAVARPDAAQATRPTCGAVELRLGADGLSLLSPGGAPSLEEALRLLEGTDLVLSLLLPDEGKPVVEFCPAGSSPGLLGRPGLLALAGPGDLPPDPGVPGFGSAASLAGFLASRAQSRTARLSLTILADGKPIKAKAFVRDIIANSLHGLLAPLKGVEGARRLEIIIEE
ncbi:MAG: hypothetical protein K9K65_18325 [Desulfarculaceae bacterium]|nr:hypothetical protein [Desulfarculaceae bacterium]MCF8046933.1 hypothetical protein [Desulfarculaceae bacterium]MCF8099801.1 hypothetical protein [Desulfarculaceae bacterium]MCF8121179.1 hypothetical protein [Desulfarculaceae bacterium]